MEETKIPDVNTTSTTNNQDVESATSDSLANGRQNGKRNSRLLRKLDWHFIPILCLLYTVNSLDRSNIGNAKILNSETGDSLLQQTNMPASSFPIAITLFAVAYSLFDIPPNILLKRFFRPSLWIGFLMLAWGSLTLGFAGVQNYATVVVLRFLIGVLEAGAGPAVCYLISVWYRKEERCLRISLYIASASFAGAFGGCIAYGAGHLNGVAGLQGFRWLFIIEGVTTILVAVLVAFSLPDWSGSTARWLSDEERRLVVSSLEEQDAAFSREHASRQEILEVVCSPRMLLHCTAYFALNIIAGSVTYFTPTTVQGLGYSSINAQLMTVPPWAVAYAVSLIVAWLADTHNTRGLILIVLTSTAGVGFLAAALLPHDAYNARYGCLVLVSTGAYPSIGLAIGWVTSNCSQRKNRRTGSCYEQC